MSQALKIGIIGGSGWLGSAIAGCLIRQNIVSAESLTLSYRHTEPFDVSFGFWTRDNEALVERSDIVILSVRPADWQTVISDMRDKLVISVMAGITLETLTTNLRTNKIIRAVPNAAAQVGASYTPWLAASELSSEDEITVRTLLRTCGEEDRVERETDLDYLTGLSGSGPAFPSLLAEAMQRHAISYGLSPEIARLAVNTILLGTGRLLEHHATAPEDVVQTFFGYGGTTAAAIEAMRAANFDQAVSSGLNAAMQSSLRTGETS